MPTPVRLLLAILLAVPLLAAAAAPLRVVIDQNYPPFAIRDSKGELEGYSVEMWHLWQQKTGVPVELRGVDWPEVQPTLERGEADVIDTIFLTEARRARFDFSRPYATVHTSIYADTSIAGIHDLDSLKGFEVGVQGGDACGERLERAGVTGVRYFPTYTALWDAVANRSIKLVCGEDHAAEYQLYRSNLHRRYVKAFEITRSELRRGVRKGDAATLALVERGMAQITPAEIEALHDKWMGRPLAFARYARYTVDTLLALGVLVLVLLVWLGTVRKAVRLRTAELEREKAQLNTLLENSPDLIWLKDGAGVYLACNAPMAALFGCPREQIIGRTDVELFGPELAQRYRRDDEAAIRAGRPFMVEDEVALAPGTRLFETLKTPIVTPDGTLLGVLGVSRDITHRRNLEESMRMANLIYQTSSEAIVVTDANNRIVDANPAFTRQTGYDLHDVLGIVPPLFESSMHDHGFYECMQHDLAARDHWQGEIKDRNKDGTFTAKFVNIRIIRQPDGRIYRHVIQFNDISEQKEKDDLIWRQTNFDPLTGLPNRRLFLDRLEQDIRKASGTGHGLGVLLLDLDRFKDINDSFGHATGDSALVELTRRIARCLPDDATTGRLGGDTFGVVVGDVERRPHLDTLAEAVLQAIAAPLHLGAADTAYVSASVGISVYPDDATGAADLVRNAEHAVHLAKRAGRGQFQYFTPSLQQQAHAKLMLTNDLRQALARRELQVYYQPIVEVATGRIHKAETLLRWTHPERGAVSPSRFIPLAEEAGLIDEIGDWVLCEAIANARRWYQRYGRVIELSVNISPTQFKQQGPLSWLDRVVHAGLPRHSITVEITEGVLISDADQAIRCLDALHAAGAKVSIDDFGTGFSALAYLKLFDVDYLKIDKSFIDNLASDRSDKALTEVIVDLAHRLGIQAIAEGVESGAQRDALAAIGCDYIQGYYYSQAVPCASFDDLLDRQMAH